MQIEYVGPLAIVLGLIVRFWPVWLALAIVLVLSLTFKKRLGLYGHLFESGVGIAGVMICLFWLFTAIFSHMIAPFAPLEQYPILKNALPGAIEPETGRIHRTDFHLRARDLDVRLTTWFRFDERLDLMVPERMREVYDDPLRDDDYIEATAVYSNFRIFRVETSNKPGPAGQGIQ